MDILPNMNIKRVGRAESSMIMIIGEDKILLNRQMRSQVGKVVLK